MKHIVKLKARVTSVVARSAASRMLGCTCELEIKHYHRTFPSTHAHYNPYCTWRRVLEAYVVFVLQSTFWQHWLVTV